MENPWNHTTGECTFLLFHRQVGSGILLRLCRSGCRLGLGLGLLAGVNAPPHPGILRPHLPLPLPLSLRLSWHYMCLGHWLSPAASTHKLTMLFADCTALAYRPKTTLAMLFTPACTWKVSLIVAGLTSRLQARQVLCCMVSVFCMAPVARSPCIYTQKGHMWYCIMH